MLRQAQTGFQNFRPQEVTIVHAQITPNRETLSPGAPITSRFNSLRLGTPLADAWIGSLAIPHRNQTTGRGQVLAEPAFAYPLMSFAVEVQRPFSPFEGYQASRSPRNTEKR